MTFLCRLNSARAASLYFLAQVHTCRARARLRLVYVLERSHTPTHSSWPHALVRTLARQPSAQPLRSNQTSGEDLEQPERASHDPIDRMAGCTPRNQGVSGNACLSECPRACARACVNNLHTRSSIEIGRPDGFSACTLVANDQHARLARHGRCASKLRTLAMVSERISDIQRRMLRSMLRLRCREYHLHVHVVHVPCPTDSTCSVQ